jgi:VanZ family protein
MPNLRPPGEWVGSDKVWHILEYAVLGGLMRRAFGPGGFWKWVAAVAATVAIGAIDECYQSLVPGRFSSFRDWMADLGGAVIGSALAPQLLRWLAGWRSRAGRMGV